MFRIEAADTDIFFRIAESLEGSMEQAARVSRDWMGQMADEILTEQKKPGTQVIYPLMWDSDKQRRAFFATGGFGQGIPYFRTGQYEGGWHISELPKEAGYVIYNQDPAAHFITGTVSGQGGARTPTGQSMMHYGRWPAVLETVANVIEKWMPNLNKLAKMAAEAVAKGIENANQRGRGL